MVRLILLVKKAEWRNWTVAKMFGETAKKSLPQNMQDIEASKDNEGFELQEEKPTRG